MLHSKDKRRIVNGLFKYYKFLPQSLDQGEIAKLLLESDIQQQKEGRRLRYLPIMIQMSADKEILEQRAAKRIDQMIDQGDGLKEIVNLFNTYH